MSGSESAAANSRTATRWSCVGDQLGHAEQEDAERERDLGQVRVATRERPRARERGPHAAASFSSSPIVMSALVAFSSAAAGRRTHDGT